MQTLAFIQKPVDEDEPEEQNPPHYMFSAGDDKNISVWDIETTQLVDTLQGHENSVVSLDFANGDLQSASLDSTVMGWDLEDMFDRVEEKIAMKAQHLKNFRFEHFYADDGKKKKKGKAGKGKAASKKKA